MLWRVQTTGGRWLYILVLLEFQSTIDRRMALRMMQYTAAIWKRLAPDDLGPGGELPFVLPVVIYNGGQRWTAATDIGDLLAPVPDELLGYLPRHRGLDHAFGGGAVRQERRGDATPTQERGGSRIDDVIRESPAMARGAGPGMSAGCHWWGVYREVRS